MIDTIELMLAIDKTLRDELYEGINDAIDYLNENEERKSKKLHAEKKKRFVHTAAFHDYGILDVKLKYLSFDSSILFFMKLIIS